MIVDDDFLDKETISLMREEFLGPDCVWIWNRELVAKDYEFNVGIEKYSGCQYNHVLFVGSRQRSDHWDAVLKTLHEFCNKHHFRIHGITRAKVNITFPDSRTERESTKALHVDHPWPHHVFLYYLNDADGDTILYNESFDERNLEEISVTEEARVSPKAGRAIFFDGLQYHTPLTPDMGYRAVINITLLGDFYED